MIFVLLVKNQEHDVKVKQNLSKISSYRLIERLQRHKTWPIIFFKKNLNLDHSWSAVTCWTKQCKRLVWVRNTRYMNMQNKKNGKTRETVFKLEKKLLARASDKHQQYRLNDRK